MIFKIIRHKGEFTIVSNTPFEDPKLSFKAKGVLIYLLTRKDDWIVHVKDLERKSTNGRDSIYSALKELREEGYAELRVERKDGRIYQKYWAIHEQSLKLKSLKRENTFKKTQTVSKDLTISKNGKIYEARFRAASVVPSFDVDKTPIKEHPTSPLVVKKFYQYLADIRRHKGRADLPAGDTPASRRTRLRTFKKWEEAASILLYQIKGNVAQIREVMQWYFKHHLDEFMPSCYAMTTFQEKFDSLQRRMAKQNGNGAKPVRDADGEIEGVDFDYNHNGVKVACKRIRE